MGIRVRFAPSPTGTLHVGGARTALFNWLYARGQKGTFILRIEDTDRERSTDESTQQILRSMKWLGLDWDEGPEVGGDHGPYFQSERADLHLQYIERALDEGLAYRCYCTPDELTGRRAQAMADGASNIGYDGRCRDLTDAQRAAHEAEGRTPVVRIRMPDEGAIKWTDIVHGDTGFECDVLDDWVALKGDGSATYNFAAVVDDGLMEISHVLRGDDHVSNTPRQIHLFKAFGFRIPKFGHMPMILGPDKQRLSKRHGAASVEDFRDQGYLPEALVNALALLGWGPGTNEEIFTTPQLIKKFSLKRLNNTAAVFDPDKLKHINGEHLKSLPDAEKAAMAWPRLVAAGLVTEADRDRELPRLEHVIRIMGNRFVHVGDAPAILAPYFSEEFARDPEGAALLDDETRARLARLAEAYEAAPTLDAATAEELLRGLAGELGVKAGELIHPARFAATGATSGPSVFDALAAVGKDRLLPRLRGA